MELVNVQGFILLINQVIESKFDEYFQLEGWFALFYLIKILIQIYDFDYNSRQ